MTTAVKKTRIALFHPALIAGGIQRVFVNLARGFVERGLSVDLVQATPAEDFRHAVPEGVRLVNLDARRALTSLLPLLRYLRAERPQVLISGAIQTNLVALLAKRIAGVPLRLILTEHNIISAISTDATMLRTRMTPFLVRRLYPWADELVAVSEGAAQDLASTMGNVNGSVHVIYNPIVDAAFWMRAQAELSDARIERDSRPIVLAVGRLHYHKDYPTLLRAFALVRQHVDSRLVFLGDGEERAALVTLARTLQLGDAVSFLGDVANPLPYMRRAKVLALSSVVEALPTVLIEALAMNLLIVATDCPTGPREILREGAYGQLVPVGDSQSLAEALVRTLRSEAAAVTPAEALERFQHDRAIHQYLKIMGVDAVSQPSSMAIEPATCNRAS